MIDRLHFISNQTAEFTQIESITLALRSGCKLIQLRVKDLPCEEILELAQTCKDLCENFGAKLVINDFPEIAKKVNAYGLHLGLDDMPIKEARKIVGDKMVIGGTANTWEHILQRIDEKADYVGVGPLRSTTTKKNLSPSLGFEGFQNITNKLKNSGFDIPIIAIGGLVRSDIPILKEAGIYGIALSGSLTRAQDPAELITFINNTLC